MTRGQICSLVLLAALLLGSFSALAQDTSEASITLRSLLVALEKVLPGRIDYESVQGKASGPFQFRNLRYRDGDLLVAISALDFDWTPTALLKAMVHVRRLRATDVIVRLPTAEQGEPAQPGAAALPELRLPLRFRLDDIAVKRINVRTQGADEPIVFDSIGLQAELTDAGISINKLEFQSPLADLYLSGRVDPVGNYPLAVEIEWQWRSSELGVLSGSGNISGDLENLALSHALDGFVDARLQGRLERVLSTPAWSLDVHLDAVSLGHRVAELAETTLSGTLESQGSLSAYTARANLTAVPASGPGPMDLSLALTGSPERIELDSLQLASRESPLQLMASGELQPETLQMSVQGRWQDAVYPLIGVPQVRSARGELLVEGTPADYGFELRTALAGDAIPAGDWLAAGRGTPTGVSLTRFGGVILGGSVRAQAKAQWSPAVVWEAQLLVDNIDPGKQWPEWPGRVSLQTELAGLLDDDGLRASVDLIDLDGSLRGRALRGGGKVAVNGDAFAIDGLEINYAGARIAAGGGIKHDWDLHWELSAPLLQELLPEASGTLRGRGSVSGARALPQITAQLSGSGIAYQDQSIGAVALEADVDMSESRRSVIVLGLSDISLGGQPLQQITLQAAGKPSRQQIEFRIETPTDELNMLVRGGMHPGLWNGKLERIDLVGRGYGAWTLEKPAALTVAAGKSTLQETCLIDPPSRLCLGGRTSDGEGSRASLQATDIPLERFAGLMPSGVFIRTRLNGGIEGGTRADGELHGTVDLNLAAGNVDLTTDTGLVTIALEGGSIRAKATRNALRGGLNVRLKNTLATDTEFEITQLTSKPNLQARLRAEVQDLTIVSALIPDLQAVSGEVSADLNARGPLRRPNIDGSVHLRGGAADVPVLGLQIRDLLLEAAAHGGDQITIRGAVNSGDGELRVDGRIEPFLPKAEVTLTGEGFELANTEEFRLIVDTDLQTTLDDVNITIEGEVTVPTAHIAPVRFGGGARASKDVILIEDEQTELVESTGNLTTRVQVVLGENVNVQAAGFKSRLSGRLLVEQEPGKAARGTGNIEILEGTYEAYGQDLAVERGLLLFAGGPIDNPGLDFRAVRKVRDVTAGVRVLGTAADPRLSLFSDPALPDTSILSYLILGRAPDGRSSGESSMLLQAATAVGTAGGNDAGVKVAERVGLDTLGFESAERASKEEDGETEETTNLVLGKYLTKDIYVGYGVGVFDAISQFLMRYQLTEHIGVETRTGVVSGGDVIYSVETD